MPRWSRIIDTFTAWLFRQFERQPDQAGEETDNEILRFRSSMWERKKKDF